MYAKSVHAESSIAAIFEFIRENPLGVLITALSSQFHPFIQSTHIPWVLDAISSDPDAPIKGRLRGHLARANPHAKTMIESLTAAGMPSSSQLEQEVMILFTSRHEHYVTPKFYTETKPATGKVAPTWNYAAAQVYGKATIHFEASSEKTNEYLTQQTHDLSEMCETSIMGYTGKDGQKGPWKVSDAPDRYIALLKKGIVGVEVTIERIEGKFKMSQEIAPGDREGVIKGFDSLGSEEGRYMANLVRERGAIKDARKAT